MIKKIISIGSGVFNFIKGVSNTTKSIGKAMFGPTTGSGSFSVKRFIALILCSVTVIDHVWLQFMPMNHWITVLTHLEVSSDVIMVIIGVRDTMSITALSVYGIAKIKNAH